MRELKVVATAGITLLMAVGPALAQDPSLRAVAVPNSAGPLLDLEAAFWKDAPAVKVPMLPQNIANPQNTAPAVTEIEVRAAHNGQWYAVLIEWADATKSDRIVLDQFGDQVALELPINYKPGDAPNPMMGGPGERMNIMQWRAAFQHDVDKNSKADAPLQNGPQIAELYPNVHVDVYPDEVLRATDARAYTGAVGVDNPISRPKRTAVIEQMAEGFGSLTAMPEQHADGRGVWSNGRWKVIITHPLAAGDGNTPVLKPGDQTLAAFAVWEGGTKEVGSRKAWANWAQLTFDPVKP
jgi:hypothetical protein